jgi:hypothetical protein
MTFFDWLRTIASALNDDEPLRPFQRYALKDMIAAYNQAACMVASYRPDLFTELKAVRLQPGKYQDFRGCCEHILDVTDQIDERGNIIREISGARAKPTMARRNWKKPSCLTPPAAEGEYRLSSVDIDPNLNGRFTVSPPVPCGVEAYVMVKCVARPCDILEDNVQQNFNHDCKLAVAAWHWVLATMLSGDRFANAAGGDKAYHFRMFFDILGVVQRQEDRIQSPEQA